MHDNPYASHVRLTKRYNADGPVWFAAIGASAAFHVADYALTVDSDGSTMLSLALPVASLQLGDKASAPEAVTDLDKAQTPTPKNERHPVSVWGAPAKDPRSTIPGWTPEVNA